MIKIVTIIFATLYLSLDVAYAYTKNRGQNGRIIKWPDGTTNVSFIFHGSGDADEENIFSQALSQWNSAQSIHLGYSNASGPVADDVNDVYFSSDSSMIGGDGVAAVTNVTYDFTTAEIVEADIIVNQNMMFSTTAGIGNYLGDVLGHEVGHAIGLAHSEVKHSSMFYWLTRGQHTLSQDDRAGAHALYPDASSSRGKLSGRVAGGQNVGVFGAHVEAISENNGSVVASGITESDGSFEIDGLPLNDNYMLYVTPLVAKATLPDFYADARSNFCTNSTSYRGAFFQSCNASEQGYAQAVSLTSAAPTNDAGTLSIHCGLEVPQGYMNKDSSFEVPSVIAAQPGNNMVGYITPDQLSAGDSDRLHIDLSSYATAGAANLYLEFHVTYQALYSVMHLQAQVEDSGDNPQTIIDQFGNASTTVGNLSVTDADGNPNMDLTGRVALSNTDMLNDFELVLEPQSFSDWDDSVAGYGSENFYSRKDQFADPLTFYLLSYRVVQNVGGNFVTYAAPSHAHNTSNLQCLDAAGTYTIVGNVEQSSSSDGSSRRSNKDDGGFACGSVDLGSGGSGGGHGGILSFLLGLVLLLSIRRGGDSRNHLV